MALCGRKIELAATLEMATNFVSCYESAQGLLLADCAPTVGGGEDFLSRQPDIFTETAVTPERKVEKSFPRWEINRHVEG